MANTGVRTTVKGKGIEVTPALRQHVEKGVERVSRLFRDGIESRVEATLSIQREQQIAEITVYVGGLILRGESRTGDLYVSIDEALAKIERQIKRYKGRLTTRLQGGKTPEKPAQIWAESITGAQQAADDPDVRVVRTKQFSVKPMDVDEAILQMELLGHDFFVFADAQVGAVNVVYRRKDGAYGLIEPRA